MGTELARKSEGWKELSSRANMRTRPGSQQEGGISLRAERLHHTGISDTVTSFR